MDSRRKDKHRAVIDSFIKDLNNETQDYVLKGGTALMLCYGLDRFSEDIDLDGVGDKIKDFVDSFCKNNNYTYRVAKDTETVNRFMIHYSDDYTPLKVEVSYRNKNISEEATEKRSGIRVYKIDVLGQQKAHAYSSRDKIRDLYDLSYICNNYFDELSVNTQIGLADAVANKGIEQFDYLIQNQEDPLIDKEKLANSFLDMMDKLGLLTDDGDQNILKKYDLSKEASISLPKELCSSSDSKLHDGELFHMMRMPKGTKLNGKDISGAIINPSRLEINRDDPTEMTGTFSFSSNEEPLIKLSYSDASFEKVSIDDLNEAINNQKEILKENSKEKKVSKDKSINKKKDIEEEL